MGGQQFASDATMIDMTGMNKVLAFDQQDGVIDIESGIEWPELVHHLLDTRWAIRQKQTGADRLTLGGSLAANAHGRGLKFKPIVGDVESITLIDAGGAAVECSRTVNRELFSLAIGGYGLFGVIASIRLRLAPRQKVQRVVEVQQVEGLEQAFDRRIADGFLYGDFQFGIDPKSGKFLHDGVFSCYRPVSDDTPMPSTQAELHEDDWRKLLLLAHVDKSQAYERYVSYYMGTSGQVYWSDEHQLSIYPNDYHRAIDATLHSAPSTEMITEIYVRAFHGRGARRLPAQRRQCCLRNGAVDRARRRHVPAVGEAIVRVRHFQSACRALGCGDESGRRCVPAAHRHGHRAQRQLLPDVSPLGAARSGRSVLSAVRRISAEETALRFARAVSE